MPQEYMMKRSLTSQPSSAPTVVELMRQEMEKHRRQADNIQKIIERWQADALEAVVSDDTIHPVVSDEEIKGLEPGEALEVYMRNRKGVKIPFLQIVAEFMAAGVNPGKPRAGKGGQPRNLMIRNLKIAVSNRTDLYDHYPSGSLKGVPNEKIVVQLALGADQVKQKKRYRQK